MVRPKKQESDVFSYMLRIRMTQEDHALLEKAAKLKSLQLSSWARSELVALARAIIEQHEKNS